MTWVLYVAEFLYHKIDARHIKNIGEQSVPNKIQAVLELVKNAYDADALDCIVTFHGKKLTGSIKIEKITIEDSGVGMTKDDLDNKFLTVGTPHKITSQLSPKFQRRVSGEKGMGHYSVQRLGDVVKIITTPEKFEKRKNFEEYDHSTYVLTLDWRKYKTEENFLAIPNDLETISKRSKFGTIIEVTELRDDWTLDGKDNDIELLAKNLKNILLPDELQTDLSTKFIADIAFEGFSYNLPEVRGGLLELAPFKIVTKLKGKKVFYHFYARPLTDGKSTLVEMEHDSFPFDATCGNVELTLFWFSGKVLWTQGAFRARDLRDQLFENHGIKIYNDKVRVMPYGEKNNDWLALNERKAGSASGGLARNVHLIGFVTLNRKYNPQIVETANRQSINENKEFASLKKFVIESLETLERKANQIIQEKEEEKKKLKPANIALVEIKNLKENLEHATIHDIEKQDFSKSLSYIYKQVELSEKEKRKLVDDLTANIETYRDLSTIGVQTIAFNHEIMSPITYISNVLADVISPDSDLTEDEKKEELEICYAQIQNALNWASSIREFASLLSGSDPTKKKRAEIDLYEMFLSVRKGFSLILDSMNINLEEPVFVGDVGKVNMNKASLESIFINLISNSVRALRKLSRERKIKIMISRVGDNLELLFEDNGKGIEEHDIEKIFVPLFTTYNNVEDRGTGMGLTIVKEIVEQEYGGRIVLKKTIDEEKHPGLGMTCFQIKIPMEKIKP